MINGKERKIKLVEFLIELLLLFFLYSISRINSILLIKYIIVFITLYLLLGRYKASNVLIWQEAKHIFIFYITYFVITLMVQPFVTLSVDVVIDELFITVSMFFLTMFFKRELHAHCFKQLASRTIVIGSGQLAKKFIETCKRNRYALTSIQCVINCNLSNDRNNGHQDNSITLDNVPIYSYNQLNQVIDDHKIEKAIICMSEMTSEQTSGVVKILKNKVKEIKYLPSIYPLVTYDCQVEDFDGLVFISNKYDSASLLQILCKRFIDIMFGIIGCILLIPLSIAIKIAYLTQGDHNPIIFKQQRIGKHGRTIYIYKYRSMVVNADKLLDELMSSNPDIKQEYLKHKKLQQDPRVTKVGQYLRTTSIDEFPQFINVLKGDMTLVGPRPYLLREINDMGNYYTSIISQKPGITGMWQVSGRSDASWQDRLVLDEYYVNNWSFWLDFTIIIKTIKVLFYRYGAR